MTEIRCECGKMLGERAGARLIVRKIGLILHGGTHIWACERCGRRQTIDLERQPAIDNPPLAIAH